MSCEKWFLNFSLKYLRSRFLPLLRVLVLKSRGKLPEYLCACFLSNHQQQRHLEKVSFFAVTSSESAAYTVKGYGRIFLYLNRWCSDDLRYGIKIFWFWSWLLYIYAVCLGPDFALCVPFFSSWWVTFISSYEKMK